MKSKRSMKTPPQVYTIISREFTGYDHTTVVRYAVTFAGRPVGMWFPTFAQAEAEYAKLTSRNRPTGQEEHHAQAPMPQLRKRDRGGGF